MANKQQREQQERQAQAQGRAPVLTTQPTAPSRQSVQRDVLGNAAYERQLVLAGVLGQGMAQGIQQRGAAGATHTTAAPARSRYDQYVISQTSGPGYNTAFTPSPVYQNIQRQASPSLRQATRPAPTGTGNRRAIEANARQEVGNEIQPSSYQKRADQAEADYQASLAERPNATAADFKVPRFEGWQRGMPYRNPAEVLDTDRAGGLYTAGTGLLTGEALARINQGTPEYFRARGTDYASGTRYAAAGGREDRALQRLENNPLFHPGNVARDLTDRPQVQATGKNLEALRAWNPDTREGDTATVLTQSWGFGEDENGYQVIFTPILRDGTILTEAQVQHYLGQIGAGRASAEDLIAADAKNLGIVQGIVDGTGEKAEALAEQYGLAKHNFHAAQQQSAWDRFVSDWTLQLQMRTPAGKIEARVDPLRQARMALANRMNAPSRLNPSLRLAKQYEITNAYDPREVAQRSIQNPDYYLSDEAMAAEYGAYAADPTQYTALRAAEDDDPMAWYYARLSAAVHGQPLADTMTVGGHSLQRPDFAGQAEDWLARFRKLGYSEEGAQELLAKYIQEQASWEGEGNPIAAAESGWQWMNTMANNRQFRQLGPEITRWYQDTWAARAEEAAAPIQGLAAEVDSRGEQVTGKVELLNTLTDRMMAAGSPEERTAEAEQAMLEIKSDGVLGDVWARLDRQMQQHDEKYGTFAERGKAWADMSDGEKLLAYTEYGRDVTGVEFAGLILSEPRLELAEAESQRSALQSASEQAGQLAEEMERYEAKYGGFRRESDYHARTWGNQEWTEGGAEEKALRKELRGAGLSREDENLLYSALTGQFEEGAFFDEVPDWGQFHMTERERRDLQYAYRTGGTQAAMQLLADLRPALMNRRSERITEGFEALAKQNGLTGAAYSFASLLTNLFGGVTGLAASIANVFGADISADAPVFDATRITQAIRSGVGEMAGESISNPVVIERAITALGKLFNEDPDYKWTFEGATGQKFGTFLYNTLMSIGDNVTADLVGLGIAGKDKKLGGWIVQAVMSSEATSNRFLELARNNPTMDTGTAAAMALADGMVEAASERFSYQNLLNAGDLMSKQSIRAAIGAWTKMLVENSFFEGQEEVHGKMMNLILSEALHRIGEGRVEGDISSRIDQLIVAGETDYQAAFREACSDWMRETMTEFLSGALAGGGEYIGSTSASWVGNRIRYNRQGAQLTARGENVTQTSDNPNAPAAQPEAAPAPAAQTETAPAAPTIRPEETNRPGATVTRMSPEEYLQRAEAYSRETPAAEEQAQAPAAEEQAPTEEQAPAADPAAARQARIDRLWARWQNAWERMQQAGAAMEIDGQAEQTLRVAELQLSKELRAQTAELQEDTREALAEFQATNSAEAWNRYQAAQDKLNQAQGMLRQLAPELQAEVAAAPEAQAAPSPETAPAAETETPAAQPETQPQKRRRPTYYSARLQDVQDVLASNPEADLTQAAQETAPAAEEQPAAPARTEDRRTPARLLEAAEAAGRKTPRTPRGEPGYHMIYPGGYRTRAEWLTHALQEAIESGDEHQVQGVLRQNQQYMFGDEAGQAPRADLSDNPTVQELRAVIQEAQGRIRALNTEANNTIIPAKHAEVLDRIEDEYRIIRDAENIITGMEENAAAEAAAQAAETETESEQSTRETGASSASPETAAQETLRRRRRAASARAQINKMNGHWQQGMRREDRAAREQRIRERYDTFKARRQAEAGERLGSLEGVETDNTAVRALGNIAASMPGSMADNYLQKLIKKKGGKLTKLNNWQVGTLLQFTVPELSIRHRAAIEEAVTQGLRFQLQSQGVRYDGTLMSTAVDMIMGERLTRAQQAALKEYPEAAEIVRAWVQSDSAGTAVEQQSKLLLQDVAMDPVALRYRTMQAVLDPGSKLFGRNMFALAAQADREEAQEQAQDQRDAALVFKHRTIRMAETDPEEGQSEYVTGFEAAPGGGILLAVTGQDGSTHAAAFEDVRFKDPGQRDFYNLAYETARDAGAETANALLDAFRESVAVPVDTMVQGFRAIAEAARQATMIAPSASAQVQELQEVAPEAAQIALELGQKQLQADTEKIGLNPEVSGKVIESLANTPMLPSLIDENETDPKKRLQRLNPQAAVTAYIQAIGNMGKDGRPVIGPGVVRMFSERYSTPSKLVQLGLIDQLIKQHGLGVRVVAVDSLQQGENAPQAQGFYAPRAGNAVFIAMDAEGGNLLNPFVHEAGVHLDKDMLRRYLPEGADLALQQRKFHSAVLDILGQQLAEQHDNRASRESELQMQRDRLQAQYEKATGSRMDADTVEEELVANALPAVIGTEGSARDLIAAAPEAAEAIAEQMNRMGSWLRGLRADAARSNSVLGTMITAASDQLNGLYDMFRAQMQGMQELQQMIARGEVQASSAETVTDRNSLIGIRADGEAGDRAREAAARMEQATTIAEREAAEEAMHRAAVFQSPDGRYWAVVNTDHVQINRENKTAHAIQEVYDIQEQGDEEGAGEALMALDGTTVKLRDLTTGFEETMAAYEGGTDMDVVLDVDPNAEAGGYMDDENGAIHLNLAEIMGKVDDAVAAFAEMARDIKHEFQHWIQYREGSPNGTAPDVWQQVQAEYLRILPEVRARYREAAERYGNPELVYTNGRLDRNQTAPEALAVYDRMDPDSRKAFDQYFSLQQQRANIRNRTNTDLYRNTQGEIEARLAEESYETQQAGPNYDKAVRLEDYVDMSTGEVLYSLGGVDTTGESPMDRAGRLRTAWETAVRNGAAPEQLQSLGREALGALEPYIAQLWDAMNGDIAAMAGMTPEGQEAAQGRINYYRDELRWTQRLQQEIQARIQPEEANAAPATAAAAADIAPAAPAAAPAPIAAAAESQAAPSPETAAAAETRGPELRGQLDEDAQYFGNTEFNQRVKSSDVLQDVSRQLMQLNATQMDGRVSYDPKDIRRIARDIKEAYGSSVSLEDLTANLTSVYTSLASAWNDAEVQSAVNALASLAYDVVEKVEVQGEEDDAAAEIRRSLRGQRLYASSTVRAEAKYRYGSYLNYRNMLRRAGITLTTDTSARPMDSWWAEMAEAYPSYFEAGIAEGDMVTRLAQVYDETRPRMVSAYDANEGSQLGTLDDAANDLALGMWQNYFNLEGTWTPTARDQTEGQARLNRAATNPRTSSDLNAIVQEKRAARAESELEAARAETAQARQEAREARAEANRAQMETNRQVNEATSRLRQQLRQEQANRQNAEAEARAAQAETEAQAAREEAAAARSDRDAAVEAVRREAEEQLNRQRQEARQQLRQARERLAAQMADYRREQREKARQREIQARQTLDKGQARERALRAWTKLREIITTPGKRGWAPRDMQDAIIALLNATPFNYNAKGYRGKVTYLSHDVLQTALAAYQNMKNGQDEQNAHPMAAYFNEDVVEDFNTLLAATQSGPKDTRLKNGPSSLNNAQMEALAHVLQNFLAAVRNANYMFMNGRRVSRAEVGMKFMDELEPLAKARDAKVDGKIEAWLKKSIEEGLLTPTTLFARLEGTQMFEIWQSLRQAENKHIRNVAMAEAYLRAALATYHQQASINRDSVKHRDDVQALRDGQAQSKEGDVFTFVDMQGEAFRLTDQELMTIYAWSRREALVGTNHLLGGGITIRDAGRGSTQHTHKLSAELLAEMIGKLSKEQIDYVNHMVSFLSNECSEWGNQVTRELYGFDKFTETYYLPFSTNQNYVASVPGQEREARIKTGSFTKQLTTKASMPLTIQGFTSMWCAHVEQMSDYNAFVLPIEDMVQLMNYRHKLVDEDGEFAGWGDPPVRLLMTQAYGQYVPDYIMHFLSRLNGNSRMEFGAGVLNTLMGAAKGAAVTFNLSVALQQMGAGIRAMAEMAPQDVLAGLLPGGHHIRENYAELERYAPIATLKSWGYFDTNMKNGLMDRVSQSRWKRLEDAGGWMASSADMLNWSQIWSACKHEAARLYPNLSHEEQLQKAGERFTEVVDKTQVVDSIFQRCEYATEKDMMRSLMAFMSEPVKQFNMLLRNMNYIRDGRKAGNQGMVRQGLEGLARSAAAIGISAALTAFLKSLVTALRSRDTLKKKKIKDEEGKETTVIIGRKTWWDRVMEQWGANIVDNLAGLTTIFGNLWGNGSSMQSSDLVSASLGNVSVVLGQLGKAIRGEEADWVKVGRNAAGIAGNLTGVGFQNLFRDIYSVGATIAEKINADTAAGTAWDAGQSVEARLAAAEANYVYSREAKAEPGKQGKTVNTAIWRELLEAAYQADGGFGPLFTRVGDAATAAGAKEDSLVSAFVKEWDEGAEIAARAAEAMDRGDLTAYEAAMAELTGKGVSRKVAQRMVSTAGKAIEDRRAAEADEAAATRETGSGAGLVSRLTTGEGGTNPLQTEWKKRLRTALAARDEAAIEQAADLLRESGTKEETIRSTIKTELRDLYLADRIEWPEAESILRDHAGINDAEDLYWLHDEWEQRLAHEGEADWTYGKWADIDESVAAGQRLTAEQIRRMTQGGATEADVYSRARSQIKELFREGKLTAAEVESRLKLYSGGMSQAEIHWKAREITSGGDERWSKYDALMEALNKGNSTDFRKEVAELMKYWTGESKTEAEKKASIASTILSKYKAQYVAAYQAGRTAEASRLAGKMRTAVEALGLKWARYQKTVNSWTKKK